MSTYARHLSSTPQTEALAGQVPNSGGGFAFPVDDWSRLDRFLVLGSDGGSYYASERKLTVDNAAVVQRCLKADGVRTIGHIVAVSLEGRAVKNEPALLALAIALKQGDPATRAIAKEALPKVARTGTHLFHLAEYVKAIGGGWGRGTREAFQNWYLDRPVDKLALQAIKYQSRDGWSHRDILRKAHPKATGTRNDVLNWMVNGWASTGAEPHPHPHPQADLQAIWAFERAKTTTSVSDLCDLISKYGLPHECVPNEMKSHPEVWEAMLPSMGLTAMIRNLGKMTSIGLISPLSVSEGRIRATLTSEESLKKARIHPLSILTALKVYSQGHGEKGGLHWAPSQTLVNALDQAFYLSFKNVEPTGKKHFLAVDVSGSMAGARISGMPMTARDASAALALVTSNVEDQTALFGFTNGIQPLKISPRSRLDDVIKYMDRLSFSNTDCALPMLYATQNKIPVDVFCVYTDSETNSNSIHPIQALRQYRQKMGRPAKLVVVGMVANEFTIADPNDGGSMDVVGFDTATPGVIADFVRR